MSEIYIHPEEIAERCDEFLETIQELMGFLSIHRDALEPFGDPSSLHALLQDVESQLDDIRAEAQDHDPDADAEVGYDPFGDY